MVKKGGSPIFIGGSPAAGKSYVAKQLAKEFDLEILVVDDFRVDVRALAKENPKKYPTMNDLINVTAEEFWRHRTPKKVMEHENDEAVEIWPSVQKKITGGFSGIIEGVSILPSLLYRTYGPTARAIFLIDRDPERIRKIIFSRGVWDDADTYADWVKELEVQWLPMHAEYFIQEAKKSGYPYIEVRDQKDTLQLVRRALQLK